MLDSLIVNPNRPVETLEFVRRILLVFVRSLWTRFVSSSAAFPISRGSLNHSVPSGIVIFGNEFQIARWWL